MARSLLLSLALLVAAATVVWQRQGPAAGTAGPARLDQRAGEVESLLPGTSRSRPPAKSGRTPPPRPITGEVTRSRLLQQLFPDSGPIRVSHHELRCPPKSGGRLVEWVVTGQCRAEGIPRLETVGRTPEDFAQAVAVAHGRGEDAIYCAELAEGTVAVALHTTGNPSWQPDHPPGGYRFCFEMIVTRRLAFRNRETASAS